MAKTTNKPHQHIFTRHSANDAININTVCSTMFHAVLSSPSPDAMILLRERGGVAPTTDGLPVSVQIVRQKKHNTTSPSDGFFFIVRSRDTCAIVQCFTLWPDASVVYDEQHEDVLPKSALFVTTTAMKRNENEKND